MLIAFLALLGVDLIVVLAFAAFVLGRKRWVSREPGAFEGAIRVSSGELAGLPPKWRRGYGRWVRDALVWTKGPFLFRNEIVAADSVDEPLDADLGEVKHLGDHPSVVRITAGSAILEVAAAGDDAELLLGTHGQPSPG